MKLCTNGNFDEFVNDESGAAKIAVILILFILIAIIFRHNLYVLFELDEIYYAIFPHDDSPFFD